MMPNRDGLPMRGGNWKPSELSLGELGLGRSKAHWRSRLAALKCCRHNLDLMELGAIRVERKALEAFFDLWTGV